MMTIRAFAATHRKSLVVIGVLLLAAVHFTGLRIASEKDELALLQNAWATYRVETIVRLEQVRDLTANRQAFQGGVNSVPDWQLRLAVSNLIIRAGEITDGLGVFAWDLQQVLSKAHGVEVRGLVAPLQTELTQKLQPEYLKLIGVTTSTDLRSGSQALIEQLLNFETGINGAGYRMESLSLRREQELLGGSSLQEVVSAALFVIGLALTFVSGWFRLDLPGPASG
jgi:hypothetical protein